MSRSREVLRHFLGVELGQLTYREATKNRVVDLSRVRKSMEKHCKLLMLAEGQWAAKGMLREVFASERQAQKRKQETYKVSSFRRSAGPERTVGISRKRSSSHAVEVPELLEAVDESTGGSIGGYMRRRSSKYNLQ